MAGFIASEEVEALTYDFNPYAPVSGTVPEPTSDQIEAYRNAIVASFKGLGITSTDMTKVDLSQMDSLLAKMPEMEAALVGATSALTGIPADVLGALPYRVSRAFMGWIMGVFFSPED